MISITHTAAEGSLVSGTYRGDGSGDILRPLGWRWSRNLDAWYLPRSRDRVPARNTLEKTREQLEASGFDVELSIDAAPRTTAEIETARSSSRSERAANLATKAARAAAEADLADSRARAISAHIPLGQPVLVDHYSAPRHLRDLARIERAQRSSIDATVRARDLERKAAIAGADTEQRFDPQAVARRICALEVQTRKLERTLTGYTNHLRDTFPPAEGEHQQRTETELDGAREQLEYWQGIRDEQIRDGKATNYSRGDIVRGDQVQYRGRWLTVIRVNPKSVSVRSQVGGSWTDTIAYAEITNHRAAAR